MARYASIYHWSPMVVEEQNAAARPLQTRHGTVGGVTEKAASRAALSIGTVFLLRSSRMEAHGVALCFISVLIVCWSLLQLLFSEFGIYIEIVAVIAPVLQVFESESDGLGAKADEAAYVENDR